MNSSCRLSQLRVRPLAGNGARGWLIAGPFRIPCALGPAGIVHPLFAFPFMLGLTYVAAWISYTYYEARFLRLKERWAR